MDLDYVYQKLWVAVDALASGTGTIQERIYNANLSALSRLDGPEDFPPEMHATYKSIEAALTDGTKAGSNKMEAIAMALSDDDAKQVAGKIFNLFCQVSDALRDNPR